MTDYITITLTAQQRFEVPEGVDPGMFAEDQIRDFGRFPQDFVLESDDSWEWEEG